MSLSNKYIKDDIKLSDALTSMVSLANNSWSFVIALSVLKYKYKAVDEAATVDQQKIEELALAKHIIYCQFDGYDPSRTIKLLQAEKTPELLQYMDQISGVVNYVNQTSSLFKEVEKVRPKILLSKK